LFFNKNGHYKLIKIWTQYIWW